MDYPLFQSKHASPAFKHASYDEYLAHRKDSLATVSHSLRGAMTKHGIWSSKHAPNVTTKACKNNKQDINSNTDALVSPALEFARFRHAVRRLKWKLPYLADSHRKATSVVEEHGISDEEKKEVETMFKLDFYEYYTVLERALVHLFGVWGVEIEVARNELTHTYHAAILTSLQAPANPLHTILGVQPVFGQLLVAKQLRNRWKNAEAANENDSPPPLGAFEIEQMLLTIFSAFEQAETAAQKHLSGAMNGGITNGAVHGEEAVIEYVEEMEWEMDIG